ncbi:MAG: uroporphyrinogen decarboxylase [Gammaproteobacteria bacterium]|nr:uroporphyrinogen decarboxylase [Gammaproteobacteria bacterium]NNJ50900.1 uroporphyrinogen decarboxylase [Gammaproteobacteria bacterium]
MSELKNDRYLKALLRQPVDRTPVWIMRQAGRYLPEYREVRKEAGDFMTLCSTPELACEVTLQPLRRFDLDAAILFSDILTIPDAMGLGLYFSEGEGPKFTRTIDSASDVNNLAIPDPADKLSYVTDAVSLIRKELNGSVPLIGFAGSPWTLATYMVEGGSSKTFSKVKALLFEDPASAHTLMSKLADSVALYLNAQIEAGAQAVMVFDSWGGALTTPHYKAFSLAYMQQIVDQLIREKDGQKIPVVLFTKGGGMWLPEIADTGCDGVGLDWSVDINIARQQIGDRAALQGNMDPAIMATNPEVIRQEVSRILADYGHGSGHVFNLGHGITPNIKPDNVAALVDAVHEFSAQYHI